VAAAHALMGAGGRPLGIERPDALAVQAMHLLLSTLATFLLLAAPGRQNMR
jgi:hypothetical protein